MKGPTFFQGVIVAAVLGILASAVVAVFVPFTGAGAITRLVIPGLALTYLLYLFSSNSERTGRATTLVLWSAMTLTMWWFSPSLPMYLLVHIGAIWLLRSLYFYSSVLSALMDMGLSVLSTVIALWAISRTGSVFLATWGFFLVSALFAAIPRTMQKKRETPRHTPIEHENFERAKRRADQALHQLLTQ
ncbi:MAG: hypothetical protein GXP15_15595 [Gammaproteobacteria bacterium]|nr:hypothetical protein [Gammaproteobacteria bacterium]